VEPHLSLDIRTTLEVITVSASGEIDFGTVDHLKETLTGLCVDGATVRLDLRDVTFIDSTGINALVIADRRSTQRGCRLVLSAPSPAVRRVLDYTGAGAVLNVDDQRAG
jgi:anti-sigma B factor antagonist